MKELRDILRRVSQFDSNEKAILATVVDVVGSGYRRAGARMLIDRNGYCIGTVSGGCLEADVLERAKKVLETGEATIVTYDTARDENSLFGLGMGCRGVIRVLLESFDKESVLTRILSKAYEKRRRQIVATVISSENTTFGGRAFYSGDENFHFQNLPCELKNSDEFRKYCLNFFAQDEMTAVRRFENGTGRFEMLFENVKPPLSLLIFGAGFDALPVIRFAGEIGWRTTVIDHRPAFADAARIPEADEIIVQRAETLPAGLFADENAAAVIMTHNYARDREILYRLLNSECRYIGALGPKKRTENLIRDLRAENRKFREEKLKNLHAPIGLDIGSETPEEIALAVIAEIKTTLAKRGGGFLRDKNQPIHD